MIAQLFFFLLFFALPDRDIEPRSTILYRSYMATVRLLVCFAISGIDTLCQVDQSLTAGPPIIMSQYCRILCLPTLLYIARPVVVSHYTLSVPSMVVDPHAYIVPTAALLVFRILYLLSSSC
jgi:hypothetical protein